MIYCYRDADGNPVEIAMTMSEMAARQRKDGTIEHDGKILVRDYGLEASGKAVFAGPDGPGFRRAWPMASDALAVHPDQVAEFSEDSRKRGVPTDFAPDGRCILTSKAHKDRYMRAYGYHDKN